MAHSKAPLPTRSRPRPASIVPVHSDRPMYVGIEFSPVRHASEQMSVPTDVEMPYPLSG